LRVKAWDTAPAQDPQSKIQKDAAGIVTPVGNESDAVVQRIPTEQSVRTRSLNNKIVFLTKEDAIGRAGKTTLAKRDREKALQRQRQDKEAKRALRKAEKASRPSAPEGEDPDLVGLRWGPQAPLY